jgi:hypothetical protein
MSDQERYLIPTKTIRWIRRGSEIVMQQWYENPIVPTRKQLEAYCADGRQWLGGQFRDEIRPVISDEV